MLGNIMSEACNIVGIRSLMHSNLQSVGPRLMDCGFSRFFWVARNMRTSLDAFCVKKTRDSL